MKLRITKPWSFPVKVTSYLLFFLICCYTLKAQQAVEQPLREVLQSLETSKGLSFTYLDENVTDIRISAPKSSWKLTDLLHYLEVRTGLQFRQIDDLTITISKKAPGLSTACGYLLDIENGEQLVGATIRAGSKFAVSDEQGYFELMELEGDQLLIESLGYQSRLIPINEIGDNCAPIHFRPTLIDLPEVVISNYLTDGIYKTLDGSFTIKPASLGILPGLIEPDILQTIQALPGIQSINETVSNINVRGGTHDQNLVLWDGLKMYQSGHFFGLISAFNPYLTENVTLIKNGTRASLNDGVSSTIDIRSNDQIERQFSGGAGLNLISGDAYLHIPISPKASIQLSGRRSIADIKETPTFDVYFDRAFRDTEITNGVTGRGNQISSDENFYFYDYSLKLLADPTPKDRIRLNLLNTINNIEYQENERNNPSGDSRTSGLVQKNLAGGITYDRLWSDRFKTTGLIYFSTYDLRALNFDILNDRRLIQENEVLDTGVKLNAAWNLTPNTYWENGYQFSEVGITNLEDISNPQFRRRIKTVLRTHALYSEITLDANSGERSLRAGVRVNYIENFEEFFIEPRLTFNQKFWTHFTVEVLGEFKSQTTSQIIDFQNDFLGVENRRWILSNNVDIPVIESQQASIGLHYQKNHLLISAEGYFKEVTGITTSSQGFRNQFEFVRTTGSYQATGIDILINQRISRVNTWASYSFGENDFQFADLDPTDFPNNLDIRHSATAGVSYHSPKLDISLGASWHTGRPFTEPRAAPVLNDKVNFDAPNNERQEDYLRVDISGTYKFQLSKKLKATLGASLWNALDRQNIIATYYQLENSQANKIERSALGITPNVVFRINF